MVGEQVDEIVRREIERIHRDVSAAHVSFWADVLRFYRVNAGISVKVYSAAKVFYKVLSLSNRDANVQMAGPHVYTMAHPNNLSLLKTGVSICMPDYLPR